MTMMPRYSTYILAKTPWYALIPAHWQEIKTKYVLDYKKEINRGMQRDNVLSLTLRGVVNNDSENPEGLVPQSYETYQLFNKNDLVFKLIDLENLRTSRVGIVHEDGIMSSAYLRLVCSRRPANPRFYY
jgi:type I restriction enzyme, S subunit